MVTAAQAICFSAPQLAGFEVHPNSNTRNPISITFLQTATRRNRNLSCRCHWDWNRWTRHFSHIQHAETLASLLQFQLEDAIESEDFREAARLKRAVEEATSDDAVAEIMSQLKDAIDDERYSDASRLCRHTGSGLVGWWVGYSKDSDDPFGRIIHISPGMGRFVGKSYNPRQLMTASPGTPLFEIYVVKNADDTYQMQVVYLQRPKRSSLRKPSMPAKSPSKPEVENESSAEIQEHEEKVERNDDINSNVEGATEEGIKSVINFLKDKIPGLKMKVMNINVEEEGAEENDSVEQLTQEDSNKTSSSESPEEEVNNMDEHDEVTLEADSDALAEEKDLDMKLFVDGVVPDDNGTPVKDELMRLPAEIQDMKRDSFVLHIPRTRRNLDDDTREHKEPNLKVAATALSAHGFSSLMPTEAAMAFWGFDKVSSKVAKSMREIVKLAISKAQKSRLSRYTSFSRITSPSGDLDPFDGLFVGAFGPYGAEVVQLKRKFGNWNDMDNNNSPSEIEFYEYVEAVKLTGDLNVPAGQVTFRAKIGKGNRDTKRERSLSELGVICCQTFSNRYSLTPAVLHCALDAFERDASYKGQGRIAEFGFQNPKWVDGELLLLNGKGFGPYLKGADIGFLYAVPEQSFIVLFNRLVLPE